MNINEIPLIIPNFNTLAYLKNLINWFVFYYPENPVYIVDNGSNYTPLKTWYQSSGDAYEKGGYDYFEHPEFIVYCYRENNFIGNLNDFLRRNKFEYYIISDADIMPHPATPPNFLEYFKAAIDSGYHRAGFGLIYEDIPEWNPKKGWIQGDQKELLSSPVEFMGHTGYRAPIDTTFCLYTSKNSGWQAPMDGKDWGNCLRLFQAYHLAWYEHKDFLNPERVHYYNSVKKRDITQPSAGRNHFQPFTGIHNS